MIGFLCACIMAQSVALASSPKLNLDIPAGWYEQAELQKRVSTPVYPRRSEWGESAQSPLLHLGVQILMENATDDATSNPNSTD